MYPESASMVDSKNTSILHLAVLDEDNDDTVVEEKIKYVCQQQNPSRAHQRNSVGLTPLHAALLISRFNSISTLCQVDQQVIREKAICSNSDTMHMSLPLHMLVRRKDYNFITPISKVADCFRLLIGYYPEAAGIMDGKRKRPSDFAVSLNLSPYVQRLLLPANPTIDPIELHRLNYEQRRMVMFLAFTAVMENNELNMWKRLRGKNTDLFRYCVSFL